MEPATPFVRLLWCALNCHGWRGGAEERGNDGVVSVPLFKGVVYGLGGSGRLEVERVVV